MNKIGDHVQKQCGIKNDVDFRLTVYLSINLISTFNLEKLQNRIKALKGVLDDNE